MNIENTKASAYDCQVEIGMGIDTGDVMAGLVGSADRLAYTTVGDDVNRASRLEGLTKLCGVKMILGDETLKDLRVTALEALAELLIRQLDHVRVKGSTRPVAIYELMFLSEPGSEVALQLERFARARTCLANRDFDGARMQLELVLAAWPDDGGALSLLRRCERYAADLRLLEDDFDGAVRACRPPNDDLLLRWNTRGRGPGAHRLSTRRHSRPAPSSAEAQLPERCETSARKRARRSSSAATMRSSQPVA